MERVQVKLVEEVAGDGDMRGVAHKRHRKHEVPKKEERTKKHKGPKKEEERTKKPKGHKKEERTKQYKGPKEEEEEERTKKPKGPKKEERTKQHKRNLAMKLNGDEALKLKGDEVMAKLMGAGSEQEGGKRRKTLRLSQELLEYLRTKEVMGFIATEMPRPVWPNISGELFDQKLKEEIAAQFKENREFDAYVLYQYRTKGYAEIDLTDDEEDEEEV
ncbi:hypothetical protein SETIT_3G403300v2 [Setaria italica]|uniref:Uncharacterized protein n=1 Tax=Setaria italica TaxID=4555 RepID=A0A368QNW8_SETIT|nr:hypothetical protein SETIT_3G403300v2 [Setaria italica]